MIEAGLFKKYFVGRDGFYWWIGQIAEESSWVDNISGTPSKDNTNQPGFGERYKVRIMGYHTAVPSELPDDHLPWASVMYPVTAGGGGDSGVSANANLRQGMFVFGFFMDGEDGQMPVIMGVIGFNDYTAIMAEVPDAKFVPFTGLNPALGQKPATYSYKAEPGTGDMAPVPSTVALETGEETGPEKDTQVDGTANDKAVTGVTGQKSDVEEVASANSAEDAVKQESVARPSKCNPIPLSDIQMTLTNVIQDIEKLQKSMSDYRYAATKGIIDLEQEINDKKQIATDQIMAGLKWVFDEAMKFAANTYTLGIRELFARMNPNEIHLSGGAFNAVVDGIICAIKAILQALLSYIADFIGSIIDKVINAARCFVENFVAAIIATVDNLITQFMNSIFDTINSFVDGAFGIVDSGLGIISSTFGIIQDFLSLLSCQDDVDCNEWETAEWNILLGGRTDREGLGDLLDKIEGFSSDLSGVIYDFSNGIDDVLNNQFEFDLESIFEDSLCDIGPILCGPPQLQLFGGTGAGFAANPVIGEDGSIIGVDILSVGSGYQPNEDVYAQVIDACGNGGGTVITPFLGTDLFGVEGVGPGSGVGEGGVGFGAGIGQAGVTDPYWANFAPTVDSGGAGGASITNPIFAGISTFGFSGLITGDQLDLPDREPLGSSPAVGITTESTSDAPLPSPFIPSSVITPDWADQSWPGIITAGRIATPVVASGFSGISGGDIGIATFPPGFFDPTGPGFTPAVNYYVNYSEIISTGATTDSQFDDEIGQAAIGVFPPGGAGIGRTGPVGSAVTDARFSITPESGLGIMAFLIDEPGGGYLKKADGSLGGSGRTWAEAGQTKIKKADGTYLLPSDPGDVIAVDIGDIVDLPIGTQVISEPLANGTGGGEEIFGGFPYEMKSPGQITAPAQTRAGIASEGSYPQSSDGTYPVMTRLQTVYVRNPGVGYATGDEVVIDPPEGSKAEITVTPVGGIKTIRVTSQGEGFKVLPRVWVKSRGGVGAVLSPILGIDRLSKEQLKEPGIAEKVIQVTDVASQTGGY